MKTYLKILSVFYFIGGSLHVLDLLDLRIKFSSLPFLWQGWIVYLLAMDLVAAVGLWQGRKWGLVLFFCIAISQLIAYVFFASYFGPQYSLIAFHLVTLLLYFCYIIFPFLLSALTQIADRDFLDEKKSIKRISEIQIEIRKSPKEILHCVDQILSLAKSYKSLETITFASLRLSEVRTLLLLNKASKHSSIVA